MGKKRKSGEPSESDKADFVPAVFARSIEEAEDFRALLDDHDIPAIVATEEDLVEKDTLKSPPRRAAISRGVAVMVPEVLLDEASEVIADREDDEEFRVGDEFEEEEDEDETADLGIDGELDDEEMSTPIPGLAVDDDDEDDEDDDITDVPDFLDDSDDELDDDETAF